MTKSNQTQHDTGCGAQTHNKTPASLEKNETENEKTIPAQAKTSNSSRKIGRSKRSTFMKNGSNITTQKTDHWSVARPMKDA